MVCVNPPHTPSACARYLALFAPPHPPPAAQQTRAKREAEGVSRAVYQGGRAALPHRTP